MCVFVFRTQEELRVREEDQQTITVEVELKRHDSEPTISVPQPSLESRYIKQHDKPPALMRSFPRNVISPTFLVQHVKYIKYDMREIDAFNVDLFT